MGTAIRRLLCIQPASLLQYSLHTAARGRIGPPCILHILTVDISLLSDTQNESDDHSTILSQHTARLVPVSLNVTQNLLYLYIPI